MGEFKIASPAINRFFSEATGVMRYKFQFYQAIEFSWKGARYRLSNTGDFYHLNYLGVPCLVQPYKRERYGKVKMYVSVYDRRNYYAGHRKELSIRDLVWAAFSGIDLPKGYSVICRDGNCANCKLENLGVEKKNGIFGKRSSV